MEACGRPKDSGQAASLFDEGHAASLSALDTVREYDFDKAIAPVGIRLACGVALGDDSLRDR